MRSWRAKNLLAVSAILLATVATITYASEQADEYVLYEAPQFEDLRQQGRSQVSFGFGYGVFTSLFESIPLAVIDTMLTLKSDALYFDAHALSTSSGGCAFGWSVRFRLFSDLPRHKDAVRGYIAPTLGWGANLVPPKLLSTRPQVLGPVPQVYVLFGFTEGSPEGASFEYLPIMRRSEVGMYMMLYVAHDGSLRLNFTFDMRLFIPL